MSIATSETPKRTPQSSGLATELMLRAEQPCSLGEYLAEVLPIILPAQSGQTLP